MWTLCDIPLRPARPRHEATYWSQCTDADAPASLRGSRRRALEVPDPLTDHVEYQDVTRAVDLEFDLIALHRLAAQRAGSPGSVTSPDFWRRLAGQLSLCDAFARESAQFLFAVRL